MKWDIEQIEHLHQKKSSIKQQDLTKKDIFDKNVLAELINTFYNRKVHEIGDYSLPIMNLKRFNDIPDEYVKNVQRASYDIEGSFLHDHICGGRGLINKIKEEDYLTIITDFLQQYFPEVYQAYQTLRKDNRILLQPRRVNKTNALGCVYTLSSFDELYAVSFFNKSFRNSSVLAHEMSHAEFMLRDISKEDKQNYIFSAFSEAIPRYIELVYANYLINIGYINEGNRIIHDFLDAFICNFDYHFPILHEVSSASIQRHPTVHMFISDIMTIKLFTTYIDDPSKAQEMYHQLHDEIGIKKDYEIFQEYNLMESKENLYQMYSYYLDKLHSYSKSRQRKNPRLFI